MDEEASALSVSEGAYPYLLVEMGKKETICEMMHIHICVAMAELWTISADL